ncbi:hypothetical protein D0X99_00610 [Algoriphagus lacus]|uniref:Uncharacterized protein n=1 Tax=Algoriphagus lacus TaxID=2056311 RepID=A0A418PVY3_9BACT|nr:hypothetical protein D0X99_00610 [Algoriphagus lacus]
MVFFFTPNGSLIPFVIKVFDKLWVGLGLIYDEYQVVVSNFAFCIGKGLRRKGIKKSWDCFSWESKIPN